MSYYLSGGTGLALQLGHRKSMDLDFFSTNPSSKINSDRILRLLRQTFPGQRLDISYRSIDQIWLSIDGVKVTFLAYPFKRKYPLNIQQEIPIADPRDIALQKAFSIGRRATARDYVDLAWILRRKIMTLADILHEAEEVFVEDGEKLFSPRLLLQQLLYTDDLEDKEATARLLHGGPGLAELMDELAHAVRETSEKLLGNPKAMSESTSRTKSGARRRVCSMRCQTSAAPVSTCRCVCGGKNHGIKAPKS